MKLSLKLGIILIFGTAIPSFTFLMYQRQFASADEINPGLYSPTSKPFGISFVDWTAKWWQWWLKIPNSQHPFADSTGERCGVAQVGPVWYLLGAAGKVERNCTIPSDKAILFPILDAECGYSEYPNLKSEQDLRECAIGGNKGAFLNVIVDGKQIRDIDKYRVTTGLFNVTYPDDPVTPTNTNVSQSVSDGWFVFLEPLKAGQHDIKFSATQFAQQNSAEPAALIDVKYHLTIK